jgi:hypothetical protein
MPPGNKGQGGSPLDVVIGEGMATLQQTSKGQTLLVGSGSTMGRKLAMGIKVETACLPLISVLTFSMALEDSTLKKRVIVLPVRRQLRLTKIEGATKWKMVE